MSVSSLDIFHILVAIHIVTGAIGLVTFWVPVLTDKGNERHKYWGRIFTAMMIATGTVAVGMATMTLLYPMETHPHLVTHEVFSDPVNVRVVFGWMMLYLAILTVNLAWYGWMCVTNKRVDHQANKARSNLCLQLLLTAAAANCIWQGMKLGQPLVMGMSLVGFATVATNLWFIYHPRPGPVYWLKEHIKAHVGAGISVYTAFFAFGAVRLMPELALTPVLWAIPLVTGLSLILYHQRAVSRRKQLRSRSPPPVAAE
ncbi:MAG: hypothetical protein AAGA00_12855 [Pseudomonadota bacterium]